MQTPIAGCVASALRGRNLNDNNGAGQKKITRFVAASWHAVCVLFKRRRVVGFT
jgi:hypothetical protein